MNIKPILFNTEMVRAILEGHKTQTRRILKNDKIHARPDPTAVLHEGKNVSFLWSSMYGYKDEVIKTPFSVGDILWVREAWDKAPESRKNLYHEIYYYRADGDLRPKSWQSNWHPSIHMPKEAARIFLYVNNVRVERLNEISQSDAIKEGALLSSICETKECKEKLEMAKRSGGKPPLGYTPVERFKALWDSTVTRHDIHMYGWEANPWVWRIEFERCEKPTGWSEMF